MSAIALITTTINIPTLLADYARDAKNHQCHVKMTVTGDRKTPSEAADFCKTLVKETGIECEYMDVMAQNAFMKSFPQLDAHLPWNCVQRRNVAILKAIVDGAQTVITIDDDNFLAEENYFGGHQQVGTTATLDCLGAEGEAFNICQFLSEEEGRPFFARGYSMAARHLRNIPQTEKKQVTMPVAVNAGLWLGDPDIDASTRLAMPILATAYTRTDNFFVAPTALTPINSQNTALSKQAIAAYFLSPYVGRYDDIFIGYLVKRIADHLGEGVSVGHPLVTQNRNTHNLFNDFTEERLGTQVIDDFLAVMAKASLSESSYAGCLLELCNIMEPALLATEGLSLTQRCQLIAFFQGCRLWGELPLW